MANTSSSTADENAAAENLIMLTADIVAAHVSNNSLAPDQLPQLIADVHQALAGLGKEREEDARPEPAVPIRSSVKNDHIVCLEDGKKMKLLKRHLMVDHGLTPDEYRARWKLSRDYPMVAPDYARKRRELAKKIGLGRLPGQKRGGRQAPKTQAKRTAAPREAGGEASGSKSSRK